MERRGSAAKGIDEQFDVISVRNVRAVERVGAAVVMRRVRGDREMRRGTEERSTGEAGGDGGACNAMVEE